MEIMAYAMSIVSAYLFLRLFQETIARKNAEESLNVTQRERDVARHDISLMNCEMATVQSERNKAIVDLGSANQTIADMMGDLSIARNERHGVVEELEKVTKERDELQAKVCNLKTNGIELLNMKIYKERVLTRLKSIIDDEVDE